MGATTEQANFGAGIYRGRKAPPGSVFDAVNALIDDESQLFKRGGSAYLNTSDAANDLIQLTAGYMPAADAVRILAVGVGTYEVSGAAPLSFGSSSMKPMRRAAIVGDYMIRPGGFSGLSLYAGSKSSINYSAGTASVVTGSKTVTGVGTAWIANADAGKLFFKVAVLTTPIPIASVDSDTQLTLRDPWPGPDLAGAFYNVRPTTSINLQNYGLGLPLGPTLYVGAAGTIPRLLVGVANRVYFTPPGQPIIFDADSFHELSAGAEVLGIDGIGDTAVVFSTRGIWTIENLDFDPVDDAGNVQHRVSHVNKDIILWGDDGVAAWGQQLLVAAIDDVWLFSLDGPPQQITGSRWQGDGGIRSLYRSYVAAGYVPGNMVVFSGHLYLPILDSSRNVVDELVCRLDHGSAWTRWSGHAAGAGFASLAFDSDLPPKLIAVSGRRLIDATGCMVPGVANDANGTTPTFTVVGSDQDGGSGIRPDTFEKLRFVYESAGATPALSVSTAVGLEAAAFTAATLKRGGGASDGTDYSAWRVGRKAERIRWKFQSVGAVTRLVLRRAEWTVRRGAQS